MFTASRSGEIVVFVQMIQLRFLYLSVIIEPVTGYKTLFSFSAHSTSSVWCFESKLNQTSDARNHFPITTQQGHGLSLSYPQNKS